MSGQDRKQGVRAKVAFGLGLAATLLAVFGAQSANGSALQEGESERELTMQPTGPDNGKRPAREATASEAAAASYCGSGYYWIDTYNMIKASTGQVRGHYLLYYNNTRNCGVAECYNNCGILMFREALIKLSGAVAWVFDAGNYRYYAGPVYSAPSARKCIDIAGDFGSNPTGSEATVLKFRVHCG